jgi:hypothetical protein
MDYRRVHFSDEQHAVTLWYSSVPLAQLLADVDTIGHALHGTAGMCVYTDWQEAVTAVPALCAARGYVCALVPYGADELRLGDIRPYGLYRFDIQNP